MKKGKEKGKRKGERKMWEKGRGKINEKQKVKSGKKGRVRGKEGKWISMAEDRSGKICLNSYKKFKFIIFKGGGI